MKKQIFTLSVIAMMLLVFSISAVSAANHKICLTKGQNLPNFKCTHDYCYLCVNDNNYSVYDKNCPGDPVCNGQGGNTTIDTQPPVLTVNSPVNDNIYNVRGVLFSLTTDEPATFYYKNNLDDREVWKKIATNVKSYSGSVSLGDGANDITIKAVDKNGNEATIVKKFRVDSLKPKITKINPTSGFANGKFEAWFTETNAKTLILNYGNILTGRKTVNVNLNSCTGDALSGKYYCSVQAPLTEYNGQSIDYSFRLTDIANNYVDSKLGKLSVDTAAPVLNNIGSMVKISGKYVNFNISITESNLLSVSYYDNSASRPKWTKLCSSLKNGLCVKKVTSSTGNHIVDIRVDDKAGNSVTTRVEFNIA